MTDTFQALLQGLAAALSFQNLLAAAFGAAIGLVVGGLPGLGSMSGVALLMPLTFKMEPTTGIIMLAAIYYANMYGGSFSSILLNIPGDSAAVMTTLDGYPMARNGMAGKALYTAAVASFIGGLIAVIVLTIIGPSAARWGLTFGPAEMAWLIVLALTSIGWVIGEDPKRGLLATALGALLATIGMTPSTGKVRFTFDMLELMSGLSFVPLVIGMFGFSGVIDMVVNRPRRSDPRHDSFAHEALPPQELTIRGSILNREETRRMVPAAARAGLSGSFIGVLPGAGATLAAFLAYIMEKRFGRNGPMMGKGALEGVAAPESANNAASVGAFAPMLALGVPGSSTTAVLMGGLMMWGLTPGPMLFQQKPDFVWGLIGSMYIGNLMCLVVAILCIPFLMKVILIPTRVLIPVVGAVCIVGAYSDNGSMFDVGVMLVAAVLGYFMRLSRLPTAPLLLSFVLVPFFERYVTSAIDITPGSFAIFFDSTLSRILIGLILLFCLSPLLLRLFRRGKSVISTQIQE